MIFFFSGTGNSKWVAQTTSAHFADATMVEMGSAVVAKHFTYSVAKDEKIGFVFPVHSWGIPWIVRKFIKKLKIDGYCANQVYCILTCGDDCGYTNKMLIRLMARKKWNCKHIYSVQMPNTYVVFPGFDTDSADLEILKVEKAKCVVEKILNAIELDTPINCYLMKGNPFLKSRIIYPLFCKFMMSSKPFYVTNECTGCGLCAKNCPTSNIKLVDGNPQWGDTCTQCLSCLHRCPARAIEYGKNSVGKGRYFYGKR